MAIPTITTVYPANADTGIPVGEKIIISFSTGVDYDTVLNGVVIYGPQDVHVAGADQVVKTDPVTLNNPFFLKTPGFKGLVPYTLELVYYSSVDDSEDNEHVVVSNSYETTNNLIHKAIITPLKALAPDTSYTVHVVGSPTSKTGVSSRTVFDVVPDVANVSTTGVVKATGSFTGIFTDDIVIEITTGGDIKTAKYRWYYSLGGVGEAVAGKVTASSKILLDDGVLVSFHGSGFVTGDKYLFRVEPKEYLASNTKFTFTTNDGSYLEAPESPSTPATTLPPATIAPEYIDTETQFVLEGGFPEDRAYNVSVRTNQIILEFSEPLDPATVTQSTVVLKKVPAMGQYSGSFEPQVLYKNLTVSSNRIIIDF